MNHWAFVASAYGITILAIAALIIRSAAAMRRAERAADELRRK